MKKKSAKRNNIIFIILLILFLLCMFPNLVYEFPRTKINFNNYDEFKECNVSYFPDKLPANSSDIKYYYHYSLLNEKYAVAVTTDKDNYELMKSSAEEYFKKDIEADIARYNEISNRKVTIDNYKTASIAENKFYNEPINDNVLLNSNYKFIKSLAVDELSEYSIVGYIYSDYDSWGKGVLSNDETNRLVYFYYSDKW